MKKEVLEKIKKFREYLDYIERHYNNVQKAWKLIQEKCEGKGFVFMYDDWRWFNIDSDVMNHDLSKLSEHEFTQYRQWFFPTEEEKETRSKELFLKAWEHHKANNLHHWQSWTKEKESHDSDVYVVQMIVDWVAMSYEFGDTAKEYYEKNKEEIELPQWAIDLMYKIFDCIYD